MGWVDAPLPGWTYWLFVAAFAVASLLALLAILTLVAKTLVEWRSGIGGH